MDIGGAEAAVQTVPQAPPKLGPWITLIFTQPRCWGGKQPGQYLSAVSLMT
jgi:hypothetical protein